MKTPRREWSSRASPADGAPGVVRAAGGDETGGSTMGELAAGAGGTGDPEGVSAAGGEETGGSTMGDAAAGAGGTGDPAAGEVAAVAGWSAGAAVGA